MSRETNSELSLLDPARIKRNPDNPRLFFRSEEMATLLASIKRFGVQVPITVYKEKENYFLIDGERRWRCADKLNLKEIPAIIQPKPSLLDNLLLMFNIHALREQWDYLTIANKLPEVSKRFKKEHGADPNEIELSELTGLSRGQIRRCNFLLQLPEKYMQELLKELEKPKSQQQLSEDFFIEMEKALKTISARIPNAIKNLDNARDALIDKFRRDVIKNITGFRKLSKIATSVSNLGVKQAQAQSAIKAILSPKNDVSIDKVFTEHFELKYDERKVALSIRSITDFLESTSEQSGLDTLDGDVVKQLIELRDLIDRMVEA